MTLTWLSAGSNILPSQAHGPFVFRSDSADDLLLDGWLLRERRPPAAHLYTYAHRRRTPMADDLVSDPVCGMKIAPADAVTSIEHEGKTYYFCSQDCADSFSESPADYV
jgi:YHS domain-containing protein